jgi:chitinase
MFRFSFASPWRQGLLARAVAGAVAAMVAAGPAAGPPVALAAGPPTVQSLDQCDLPCAWFTPSGVEVAEGDAGTRPANLQIHLTRASTQPVTVSYRARDGHLPGQSAVAGADYQATSGSVTFQPGEVVKTVSIPVLGDLVAENYEYLFVDLTEAVGARLYGDHRASAGVMILDNDTLISVADRSLTEGDAGTRAFAFTVSLSRSAYTDVTVRYATAAGTAAAGSDFTHTSGTLVFPSGATSRTVVVPVKGDPFVEPDETFFVNLSHPTNARLGDGQGRGTVKNDDVPGGAPCPIPNCETP